MLKRESDFAGSWYPGRESECLEAIEAFCRESAPCPSTENPWKGGIVPHAGWFYSGRIACNVIKCLSEGSEPDTIVLFGRHLHPASPNFIMKEGVWATPLGDLAIDQELGESVLTEFPFRVETASNHDQDNTIELQLPFVRYFFPKAKILPMGLPPAVASLRIGEKVAEISNALGRRTLMLGSTDLTHYGYNYGFIPKGVGREAVDWVKNENDKAIVELMLNMEAEAVIHEALRNSNACCSGAAAAAVAASKGLGADRGQKLIYATSYDIRPDTSFVGYVGIVFS